MPCRPLSQPVSGCKRGIVLKGVVGVVVNACEAAGFLAKAAKHLKGSGLENHVSLHVFHLSPLYVSLCRAEVLARARLRLCGAGLGGVHGHGQGPRPQKKEEGREDSSCRCTQLCTLCVLVLPAAFACAMLRSSLGTIIQPA